MLKQVKLQAAWLINMMELQIIILYRYSSIIFGLSIISHFDCILSEISLNNAHKFLPGIR